MSKPAAQPRLTVGVPVYNGAAVIGAALQSLHEQTFADFEVLISDNGSTDGTEAICRAFVERDSRFRYVRQPSNLGAPGNFRYVLDAATGRYFHWMAADDVRSPTFLADNVAFLDAHPDYVASTGRDRFLGDTLYGEADFDIVGAQLQRFRQFLRRAPRSHGIFYSVIRADVLRRCDVVGETFWASDWAIDMFLARHGHIHRVQTAWSGFGTAGASNRKDAYKVFRGHPFEALFPFYSFSRYAWSLGSNLSLPERLVFLGDLARLNLKGAYDRTFSALYRHYRHTLRPIVRRQ